MNDLIYPNEKRLGALTLGLGLLIWLLLIVGTFGLALGFVLFGFLVYLVTQSVLISHLKGNGVEISEEQCPELYAQFMACCRALQVDEPPKAYLLHGGGELNAFATKFLGTHYVVLLSSVVDAMVHHPDGVRFYIGHELGHIRSKHLGFGQLVRWPALWLPLIGAAYSRARESTCDRHGRACCQSAESATRALTALAAGTEQWKEISLPSFVKQAQHSSGFWMSLHELLSGYPWLTKRALRIMDPETAMPKRNSLAYLPALFQPSSCPTQAAWVRGSV